MCYFLYFMICSPNHPFLQGGLFRFFMEPRVYTRICILLLYTIIFAMLFDVGALLYNPFGARDIDINVS